MIQLWAIYRSGGDRDLGASVAAQMDEVCESPAGADRSCCAGPIWVPLKSEKMIKCEQN
jgi:hypothetical protein